MRVEKAPNERLDYKWDWNDWLEVGETINAGPTVVLDIPGALTVETPTPTPDNRAVVAWISDGTIGQTVQATAHIVTSDSREAERTIIFNITKR